MKIRLVAAELFYVDGRTERDIMKLKSLFANLRTRLKRDYMWKSVFI